MLIDLSSRVMCIETINSLRVIELAELHAAALPNPGRTAHRIVEVVAADFEEAKKHAILKAHGYQPSVSIE